jgi:transcriptional regulator with XRE-family HTH domain
MPKKELQALRRILATQIRHYRRSRGWTQSQLAERCSLSLDMLGRLERGTASPSLDTVARLAESLGIQAATLLGGRPLFDRKRDNRSDRLSDIFALLIAEPGHELDRVYDVIKAILRD